jgi:hypothetical protein
MPTFSNEIIEAAIAGFEAQKQRIDGQIAELRAMLDGRPAKEASTGKAKSKFSPETLRRMRDAQQRRWAKVKSADKPTAEKKPKRKLSAAGKANIVAALKKRWAAKKAASKVEGTSVAKTAVRKKA